MYKLAAIVGPTAVGKTSTSIKVAQTINAEIISCDSMQIYKDMNIGTAKASPDEQAMVPHHLIDFVKPDEDFSVAQYQKIAKQLVCDLNAVDKVPLLVGGTGLYFQSLVDDYAFFPLESRQKVRDRLNQIIEDRGMDFVYKHLASIDPVYAAKISANDQKRIVRALEVYELTGESFSSQQRKRENTYNLALVGLYLERPALYKRIDLRVDEMLKGGLIEEVQTLREQGYDLSLNSMQALGYKQVYNYLEGFISGEQMSEEIKRETRRYAKRQYTWFNKDKRIHWINVQEYPNDDELARKISVYIGRTIN
ncbi:MAG: tRNA (adenosine(37)-N6)-dimethylallyltransferase MiaA [Syntrophomonas sp.]